LTLTNIAERVNLSPQYLGKLFSEALGESFHQYVTRMRIDKAKQLLQESDLLVYEVAEQVGIPNYRYFSTLYKKMTGKTPKDVRNGNVI
jgi:two-component system response regulator YesN